MPQVNPFTVLSMIGAHLQARLVELYPSGGPTLLEPQRPDSEMTPAATGPTVRLANITHTPVATPSGPDHTAIDELQVVLEIMVPATLQTTMVAALNTAVMQVRNAISDQHITNADDKHVVWIDKLGVSIEDFDPDTGRNVGHATLTGKARAHAWA